MTCNMEGGEGVLAECGTRLGGYLTQKKIYLLLYEKTERLGLVY